MNAYASAAPKRLTLLLAAAGVAWPAAASAQSTVSLPNTLDVSTSMQFGYAQGVFFTDLQTGPRPTFEGPTLRKNERHISVIWKLNAEYSTPLPGLAVNVSLPFQQSWGMGQPNFFWHPETYCETPPASPLASGSGCTHQDASFLPTDLKLGARYMLPVQPFGVRIVPNLSGSFPVGDYPVWGHGAYGTGLKTFTLGFDAGRNLAPLLPDAFIDVGYSYTASESIHRRIREDVAKGFTPGPFEADEVLASAEAMPGELASPNRSDMYVRAGYFVHPTIAITAGVYVRLGHGGFTWTSLDQIMKAVPVFTYYHDPLAKASYVLANVGVSWAITDWLSIYGLGFHTFTGSSTMPLSGAEIGVSTSVFFPDLFADEDDLGGVDELEAEPLGEAEPSSSEAPPGDLLEPLPPNEPSPPVEDAPPASEPGPGASDW